MDIRTIRKVMDLMSDHEVCELEWEEGESRLMLRRGALFDASQVATVSSPGAEQAAAGGDEEPGSDNGSEDDDGNNLYIRSPIVGTFYRSASPDADMYVQVGDEVEPGTVVCIVEAMKVMNEIQAEQSGIIREVLVDNATAVDYGQPLYRIETL